MKKSMLVALASGLLLLGMMGNAMAYTISYTESYNPGTNYLMDAAGSGQQFIHNWIFDITDNPGWTTPNQLFNDGTITLVLEDDDGGSSEKASFIFEIGPGVLEKSLNFPAWTEGVIVSSLAFGDGSVAASLTATSGDFFFRSATLNVTSNVNGGSGTAVVPEPSTLVLLGSGLLGLCYVSRSRRRK